MASASGDINLSKWNKIEERLKSRQLQEEKRRLREEIETSLQVTHHKIVSIDNVIKRLEEEKSMYEDEYEMLLQEQSNRDSNRESACKSATKLPINQHGATNELDKMEDLKIANMSPDGSAAMKRGILKERNDSGFLDGTPDKSHEVLKCEVLKVNAGGMSSNNYKDVKREHDQNSLENEPPLKKRLIDSNIQQCQVEPQPEFEQIIF